METAQAVYNTPQVQYSGQDPLPPPHFQYNRPTMPEPQHPMPNQLGGPLPNQMPNQINVPVQSQGGPIPPSLSPGYRGPPGPGPPGPRMPRGPPYMDGPPPDQMIGAPPSPRYDGRPIMDPVWPPRGDPAGENEFDLFLIFFMGEN